MDRMNTININSLDNYISFSPIAIGFPCFLGSEAVEDPKKWVTELEKIFPNVKLLHEVAYIDQVTCVQKAVERMSDAFDYFKMFCESEYYVDSAAKILLSFFDLIPEMLMRLPIPSEEDIIDIGLMSTIEAKTLIIEFNHFLQNVKKGIKYINSFECRSLFSKARNLILNRKRDDD